MIKGAVNANREARLRLTVRGLSGQEREIEAVIDTGFNGFLTLTSISSKQALRSCLSPTMKAGVNCRKPLSAGGMK